MSSAITIAGDLFPIAEMQRAVNDGLDVAAELVVEDMEAHQQTWSSRSRSAIIVRNAPFLREIEAGGKIYRIVDHGRRGRTIVAKRARFLRFRANYTRKTTPRQIPSKQGGASGEYVYRKQVTQKPSKPSFISETLQKKYRLVAPQVMDVALSDF